MKANTCNKRDIDFIGLLITTIEFLKNMDIS